MTAKVDSFYSGIMHSEEKELKTNAEEGTINLTVINQVGSKLPVTGTPVVLIMVLSGSIFNDSCSIEQQTKTIRYDEDKQTIRKERKKFRNLLFWAGFLICIFPVISNIVERQRQADAVATYRQTMEKEDEKEIEEKWRQANEYNEMLFQAKGEL